MILPGLGAPLVAGPPSILQAFATVTHGNGGANTDSITLPAGTKCLVVMVTVHHGGSTGGAILSSTYNGVALTRLFGQTNVSGSVTERTECWYLMNPLTGSAANFVMTANTIDKGFLFTRYATTATRADSTDSVSSGTNPGSTSCQLSVTNPKPALCFFAAAGNNFTSVSSAIGFTAVSFATVLSGSYSGLFGAQQFWPQTQNLGAVVNSAPTAYSAGVGVFDNG